MKSNQSNVETSLVWLATLGGLGRAPVASGSVATLVAGVPAAWAMSAIRHPLSTGVLLTAFLLVSWLACDVASKRLGKKDPREVVVDELAGYLVTMLALPATWFSLSIGFLLFRIFDIWKPWLIRVADTKVPGGLGILLDDLLAGLAAHLLLRVILALWP
ncbi:MAG: phosphatidylglycerophosphatase A [Syntrophobacteraceae bacterium]